MHRFEMQVDANRDRYLKTLSDRLHDRFLERPALLDLGFIRQQLQKVESLIAIELAKGLDAKSVYRSLGEPNDYADKLYAQFLAGPHGPDKGL